jgi:hypothetical protein
LCAGDKKAAYEEQDAVDATTFIPDRNSPRGSGWGKLSIRNH